MNVVAHVNHIIATVSILGLSGDTSYKWIWIMPVFDHAHRLERPLPSFA